MPQNSRRSFLKDLSVGLGAFSIANALPELAAAAVPKTPRKLGIALVGLGSYATKQLAPALDSATDCYLSGIVTGTKEKESVWRAKYGIKKANIYNYENFDSIASNDDIDIVYIVLPNSMHAEYTIRAAKAGKHVICEKPMALTAAEGHTMIDACKANRVMLSIGYRLHFDPNTIEIMKLAEEQPYGPKSGIGVHCKAARNRTHFALCVIMMILHRSGLEDADLYLQRIRPNLFIDSAHWMKVDTWAK